MPDAKHAAEAPQTLAEALAALQAKLPRVAKENTAKVESQTGRGYSYKYADLTDVSEAILPLMAALGLVFTCCPTMDEHDRFVLRYQLMHTSGGNMLGEYPLPRSGTSQEIGKAITYARRHALCAVTGLAPGGDDDDAAANLRAGAPPVDLTPALPRTGTNAQLRAQGRMDRKQKSAHEDMAADTVSGGGIDRSNDPADADPWTDQPAGEWAPVAVEDKPGSSNSRQHQRLGILYNELGITERDTRLAEMTDRVGREITSAKDLSYSEAEAAIKELRGLATKLAKQREVEDDQRLAQQSEGGQ